MSADLDVVDRRLRDDAPRVACPRRRGVARRDSLAAHTHGEAGACFLVAGSASIRPRGGVRDDRLARAGPTLVVTAHAADDRIVEAGGSLVVDRVLAAIAGGREGGASVKTSSANRLDLRDQRHQLTSEHVSAAVVAVQQERKCTEQNRRRVSRLIAHTTAYTQSSHAHNGSE